MVEVWRQKEDGKILVNPYALSSDDIGRLFEFHGRAFTLIGYKVFLSAGELQCRVWLASGGPNGSYMMYGIHDEKDWMYRL